MRGSAVTRIEMSNDYGRAPSHRSAWLLGDMAAIWLILSLFYFGACTGLFSCSVLGLCRPTASSALATWLRRFRFAWFLSVALLVVFYGVTLAAIGFSDGWREALRADGAVLLVYLACGVLLPFILAIERWQHRFLLVLNLVVATVSLFVYGRAFLIVSAGA